MVKSDGVGAHTQKIEGAWSIMKLIGRECEDSTKICNLTLMRRPGECFAKTSFSLAAYLKHF